MNLVVDYGNTLAKVGIFEDEHLLSRHFFEGPQTLQAFVAGQAADNIIVSSVSFSSDTVLSWSAAGGKKISMSPLIPVPVTNLYKTPATLGVDRIAAVCGALVLFPGEPCLVIDAGTCINYEFLDASANYHGGAISPGLNMRFEAMHRLTARLPLAGVAENVGLTGNSTETCLQSGVMNGASAEIEGIIGQYVSKYPAIKVLLCGGDAHFFENGLNKSIFAAPDLVLIGLNGILRHGLNKK